MPAFSGLGAPYWSPKARGTISGLTRNTGVKEIVRAVLESTAYQTNDLIESMNKDGLKTQSIKVDGGMVKNDWLCQFLADVIDIKVYRAKVDETTALGAAFMAGLKIGVYKSFKEIKRVWKFNKCFLPSISTKERKKLTNGWLKAVRRTLIY